VGLVEFTYGFGEACTEEEQRSGVVEYNFGSTKWPPWSVVDVFRALMDHRRSAPEGPGAEFAAGVGRTGRRTRARGRA
jgi:hypothetical protein